MFVRVSSKGNPLDSQLKRQKLNQNKRARGRQCKLFAENGSCRFGSNCKYAHVPGAKAGEDVSDRVKQEAAEQEEQQEQTAE